MKNNFINGVTTSSIIGILGKIILFYYEYLINQNNVKIKFRLVGNNLINLLLTIITVIVFGISIWVTLTGLLFIYLQSFKLPLFFNLLIILLVNIIFLFITTFIIFRIKARLLDLF